MFEPWWAVAGLAAALAALVLIWRPLRRAAREARFAQARHDFHRQRERLEAKFVRLAAAKSQPNAPHWDDCDFDNDVAYVRNRATGELSAFVAVTVAMSEFEEPGGLVGGAIGNLRAATAVFRFDRDHWETDGRAILNLSPVEAIRIYRNELEIIDHEFGHEA
jgi:hypothetical protein